MIRHVKSSELILLRCWPHSVQTWRLRSSLTGARFDIPNGFDPILERVIPNSIHVLLCLRSRSCLMQQSNNLDNFINLESNVHTDFEDMGHLARDENGEVRYLDLWWYYLPLSRSNVFTGEFLIRLKKNSEYIRFVMGTGLFLAEAPMRHVLDQDSLQRSPLVKVLHSKQVETFTGSRNSRRLQGCEGFKKRNSSVYWT